MQRCHIISQCLGWWLSTDGRMCGTLGGEAKGIQTRTHIVEDSGTIQAPWEKMKAGLLTL